MCNTSLHYESYRCKHCSYLLWWTFYFLQVLLYHLLWSFTCRQRGEGTEGGGDTCWWIISKADSMNVVTERPSLLSGTWWCTWFKIRGISRAESIKLMHLWKHNYVFSAAGLECLPLRACFLVVFLQQWPKPCTGLMSLLLTGGGCSTSLGGLVRHTGRAAALIKIPVIPEIQRREMESG